MATPKQVAMSALLLGVSWWATTLLSGCAAEGPRARADAQLAAPPGSEHGAAAVPPGLSAAAVTPDKTIELKPRPPTDDEVICRREVLTGSHWPREVCMTRGRREEIREKAQEWYRTGGREGSPSVVSTP